MCLLTSCSQTPDNIQGNNHNVDLNSENNKVSVEHILDDFDEAFETEYSKFKLPSKDLVHIEPPDKVYNLILEYKNKGKNVKWAESKANQISKVFCNKNNIKVKNIDNYSFDGGNWKIGLLGNVSYLTENYDLDFNSDAAKGFECIYGNRIDNLKNIYFNIDKANFNIEKAVGKCTKTVEKIVCIKNPRTNCARINFCNCNYLSAIAACAAASLAIGTRNGEHET